MKENAKKTKWYIHWPKEDFDRILITDSSNGAYQRKHTIAQVAKRHRFAKRNAHLIAQAPDLYAKLEEVKDYLPKIVKDEVEKLLARARSEGK